MAYRNWKLSKRPASERPPRESESQNPASDAVLVRLWILPDRIKRIFHLLEGREASSPSEADIKVTRDLIRAGRLLKLEVLDYAIVRNGSFSHSAPLVFSTTDHPRHKRLFSHLRRAALGISGLLRQREFRGETFHRVGAATAAVDFLPLPFNSRTCATKNKLCLSPVALLDSEQA